MVLSARTDREAFVELRLLRSFLVLAEELHFGRAAERLHIAQPPLTKQIRQLEHEIGVQLFERHSRGVRLTEAGSVLVERARVIFADVEDGLRQVRAADLGEIGTLRFGFSGALGGFVLPHLIKQIRGMLPQVQVSISRYRNSSAVLDSLVDGNLDLGFVFLPVRRQDVHSVPVARHRILVAAPSGHRFEQMTAVPLESLADEDIVALAAHSGSVWRDRIDDLADSRGLRLRIVQETEDTYGALALVGGGVGVSLVLSGIRSHEDTVVYRPLAQIDDELETGVAWRAENPSALVRRSVASLSSLRF